MDPDPQNAQILAEYLGRIETLGRRTDDFAEPVRELTLQVLENLGEDGRSKGTVVEYLYTHDWIYRHAPVVSLAGADLSRVDLRGRVLADASLAWSNMRRANLEGAVLRRTDFTGAQLGYAQTEGADFQDATLDQADIESCFQRVGKVKAGTGAVATWRSVELHEGQNCQFEVVGHSMEKDGLCMGDRVVVHVSSLISPAPGRMYVLKYLPYAEEGKQASDDPETWAGPAVKCFVETCGEQIRLGCWKNRRIGDIIVARNVAIIGAVVAVYPGRRWEITERPAPLYKARGGRC